MASTDDKPLPLQSALAALTNSTARPAGQGQPLGAGRPRDATQIKPFGSGVAGRDGIKAAAPNGGSVRADRYQG